MMSNYRPISILPCVSKIAEKWVSKLITKQDKGFAPLYPMQFGFRAHHSAETANCVFVEKVKCMSDTRPYVGAVFLDLRKACARSCVLEEGLCKEVEDLFRLCIFKY